MTDPEEIAAWLGGSACCQLMDWRSLFHTYCGMRERKVHREPFGELIKHGLLKVERDYTSEVRYAITALGLQVKQVLHRRHDPSSQRASESIARIEKELGIQRTREECSAMEGSAIWGAF